MSNAWQECLPRVARALVLLRQQRHRVVPFLFSLREKTPSLGTTASKVSPGRPFTASTELGAGGKVCPGQPSPKACVERLANGDGDLLSSPEASRSAAQLYQDEFSRLNQRYPCRPSRRAQPSDVPEDLWSLPTTVSVDALVEGEKEWAQALASVAAEEAPPSEAPQRTGPRVVLEDALRLIREGRCLTKERYMSAHQ